MPLSPMRWILLGSFAIAVAGCSGAGDGQKPGSGQTAAAKTQGETQAAAKAGPDPSKFIERFDANKDGVLQLSELPPRLGRWLAQADADKDGKLSADELRAHAESMKKEHFARLDGDKDGALSESEVGDRRWQRLKTADENQDGKLTLAELDKAVASGKPGLFGKVGFGPGRRGPGGPGKRGWGPFAADANQDGAVTADEVGPERWKRLEPADADKDGKVTRDELKAARKNGTLAPPKGPKPDFDEGEDDGPDDE